MSVSPLRFAEHADAAAGDAARRNQPTSPWRDIVGRLARSCGARTAALVIHDLNGQRGYIHTAFNIDLNFARAYAERYAAQNVWLDVPERFQVVGSAFRGSELLSDEELTATSFYGEWLRPQDVLSHMFGVVACENDSVAFLMFSRRRGDPPFEDGAVAMVQAVLPAAAATLRLERQMGMLRSRLMLTWSILDELAIGVLIVDGGGRILGINATGRDIMGARNGVAARNGYLSCERQRDAAKLRSVLDAVAMGGGGGHDSSKAVSISRDEGLPALQLVVSALPNPAGTGAGAPNRLAVFIWEPERPVQPRNEWLNDLYGLSRVDGEIAAMLCNGMTPEEVAARQHASIHTIRAHLKRIFLKTGATRQSALVRLLLFGPGILRTGSKTSGGSPGEAE